MNESIQNAILFALEAHKNQKRKGSSIPYIYHPMGAARIIMEQCYDQELVIAALLHDTIEDTEVDQKTLLKQFGQRVLDLVLWVTEIEKSHSWQERKEEMISRLKDAPLDALRVSIADKIDNLDSIKRDLVIIGDDLWSRFYAKKEKQAWYYREMGQLFKKRLTSSDDQKLIKHFQGLFDEIF